MDSEPRMPFDQEPDALEKRIRAGFGVALGVLVSVIAWAKLGPFDRGPTAALFLLSILGCGYGAVRYGDRFWYGFLRALRWF
jgi:hypothetical protein